MTGEHDLPGEADLCERLADGIPNARREMIPGSAHCPSLDEPERLDDLVLDFVGTLNA